MDDAGSEPIRTPRMHSGGKLSFRRRVQKLSETDVGPVPLLVGGEDPPPLAELIPDGFSRVEIEVGPGKGAYLLAATEARPETFLLGIEAAHAYAEFAATRLAAAQRTNGFVLVDNAKLFLADRVEPGSLDRLHVYYPDPWPKRRHRNRRFFTEDVLAIVHRALKPGGWLLIATDNPGYAGQIAMLVGASPLFHRDEDEEARLLGGPPGHGFTPTSFERKYVEQGRVLRRYAFRT